MNTALTNCGGKAASRIEEEGNYLFPNSELAKLDNEALLDFIERNIADALDATDGSDFNSDIRIDTSQDYIEQARDLLLSRGHLFSADAQERMSFLRWPLSDEQRAQQAITEAEESSTRAAAGARFRAFCADMEAFVRAMVAGGSVEPPAAHWYIVIGDSRCGALNGLSGADVLRMVASVQALTGAPPRLSYGCSRVGVTIESDPAPAWSIEVPLTTHAGVWELLKKWMATLPISTYAEAWDMRPEAADEFYVRPHVSVSHCFNRNADVVPTPLDLHSVPADTKISAGWQQSITKALALAERRARRPPSFLGLLFGMPWIARDIIRSSQYKERAQVIRARYRTSFFA